MKIAEIRELSPDAIQARLNDVREELMKLRFQQATGELTDYTRLRQLRHDIARILTVINELEQTAMMDGEK